MARHADGVEERVVTRDEDRLRVVITGGSAGIGAAMVRAFADAGHFVLFSYLRSVQSATQLAASYPRATMTHLDQGDFQSVTAFGETVCAWCGDHGVDVLINNAALGSATVKRYVLLSATSMLRSFRRYHLESSHSPTHHDSTRLNGHGPVAAPEHVHVNGNVNSHVCNGSVNGHTEDFRHSIPAALMRAAEDEALMRVNSLGPLWVTEAVMPLVRRAASAPAPRRSRATIVFIGSVGGGSSAVFPEYRPSDLMGKAAMTYLSKHLAAEHMRDSIDVMCVSPGATETDMFRESTLSQVGDVAKFIKGMPKCRLIQPEDVAETVKWLATSSAARIFHGAVMDASLGLAVRPGMQTELKR